MKKYDKRTRKLLKAKSFQFATCMHIHTSKLEHVRKKVFIRKRMQNSK